MSKQELHPRTVVINKNQKNQSKKARTDALNWLAKQFPAAFDNSLRIRPLKTGIMDDILDYADQAAESDISKSKLRQAVVLFTRRLDYLACLKSREARIDLNGNEVSIVTEEEAEHAASKIKKRIEKGLRNARKAVGIKVAGHQNNHLANMSYPIKANHQNSQCADEQFPVYPARNSSFTAAQKIQPQSSKPPVLVKHKSSKPYDPDAVARLKEKLGLSRNTDAKVSVLEE